MHAECVCPNALEARTYIRLFLDIQFIVMTDIVDLPNIMPLISWYHRNGHEQATSLYQRH